MGSSGEGEGSSDLGKVSVFGLFEARNGLDPGKALLEALSSLFLIYRNRIKECQLDLFADRTSTARIAASLATLGCALKENGKPGQWATSVPKTLIRSLLSWFICNGELGSEVNPVFKCILQTPATPELGPSATGIWQRAEEVVGPHPLVDFFLYYMTRFGYRPSKVAFLAAQAWADASSGNWPTDIGQTERVAYTPHEIQHWLTFFLKRFLYGKPIQALGATEWPEDRMGG